MKTSYENYFVIQSHEIAKNLFKYINETFQNAVDDGKPLVVRISQRKTKRSTAQNNLYWAWLGQIEVETGNEIKELHKLFRRKYLAKIFARNREDTAEKFNALMGYKHVIKTLDNEEKGKHVYHYNALVDMFVEDHLSTTDASVEDFAEYLNKIEQYAYTDMGVKLFTPLSLKWCHQFTDEYVN